MDNDGSVVGTEEDILDADQAICDAHHHLWSEYPPPYELGDFRADTGAGHRIVSSVFIDVGTHYRPNGPEHLRPVGETEWIASQWTGDGLLAGIVSFADLGLADAVEEVLAAHVEAGAGRFRGVRHNVAWDDDPRFLRTHGAGPHALADPAFSDGVAALGRSGLSFETWCYFHQLPDLFDLAAAHPEVPVVINHLGGPLGVGPYHRRRSEVEAQLKESLLALAGLESVYVKLGGIGMTDFGSDWPDHQQPVSSIEAAQRWGGLIRWCIETFGPERCMFESNFPVDRVSLSYATLWNAFKRIVADYSPSEKDALFWGTASAFYRVSAPTP